MTNVTLLLARLRATRHTGIGTYGGGTYGSGSYGAGSSAGTLGAPAARTLAVAAEARPLVVVAVTP
jgi:hypothetical protein